MEALLDGLGIAALVSLALVGLAVGWVVGALTRRGALVYALIGACAAMATPFLLAAFGITVLAAGGLFFVLVMGAIGAAVIVGLVRLIMGRRD